jgi:exocyst complex component 8
MDKGISLRRNRTGKLKISNPTLISAPQAATANSVEIGSLSSLKQTTNGSSTTLASVNTQSRARNRDDRTTDLVKRRYSTRFTNLQDLAGSQEQIPTLPSIPAQFSIPPPSRDGGASIRSLRVDPAILKDPNFDADDCKLISGVLLELL